MTNVTNEQDVRKLLPRKSTRSTPRSPILDTPKFEEQGGALIQTEALVEKEKSIKKQKVQKQVEVDQPTVTKGKGNAKSSRQ